MHRRRIVALSASVALLAGASATTAAPAWATPAQPLSVPAPILAGINLDTATIPQLQQAMNQGKLTSVQLTEFYLQRIALLNPVLHAVISTNSQALALAKASDKRRREHATLGPMDGIPVLLKDNIDTGDTEGSDSGSYALAGSTPSDAGLVTRLRAAGVVLLGKANESEWADFRSTGSSSGWSAEGGQTANPYVLADSPCGSSSGPGSAVAADLSTVAIGTETDGSVVCPAAMNGDVGIKPSLGLVSRSGVVPITEMQDTPGPIARNVTDAAILLGVMEGPDPRDPITVNDAAHDQNDYLKFLKPGALKGMRIGVWTTPPADDTQISAPTLAVFNSAVAQLQALGATTVPVNLPHLNTVDANEFPAIFTEFKYYINQYLTETPGVHPANLAGLIQFDIDNASVEMPYFNQEIFQQAEATTGNIDNPAYMRKRADATDAAQLSLNQTLQRYHLSAIVTPTENPAWPIPLGTGSGDDGNFLESSTPAAVSGYADMTVPMGFVGPLPVGMSVMGGDFSEPTLLSIAYAFQQGTNARQAPTFLPTAPAAD